MTAKKYKEYKGLRKESLRDNMSDIEVTLADLGELATRELTKKYKPYGLKENKKIAKVARDELENNLNEKVISDKNNLTYEYLEDKNNIEVIK